MVTLPGFIWGLTVLNVMFSYKYPRPALTVDCVVFGINDGDLQVLLIRRANEPFAGTWALPGGFVDMNETAEESARRELKEETGLHDVFLEQLYTFSDVHRDPRERVVSVAYFALVPTMRHSPTAASDATHAKWHPVNQLPQLAFDHQAIINVALKRLRGKIRYQPIGFELLPERFPLRELQHLYEVILSCDLDKRNFRRKILSMGLLEELKETETGVSHRAAGLYRFDMKKYASLQDNGFHFEI